MMAASDLDSDYETFPEHTRIPHDDILALYAELTVNGEYDLLPYELQWKARGPLLLRNGYRLRKRYDLNWQPSWEETNINPFYCEDSIDSSTPNVMDAIREYDGLPVAIKATLSWTTEAPIAFLFTDGDAVAEPRNHCVPILDTFIDETEAIVYIVMPLLRAFNDPAFVAVAEVIDFVDQMIQGIEYMHEQNVAHRDITASNIMMDASELFPEGFHPVRQNLSRNGLTEVVGIMRTHAPVRYYLIDFDSAIAFEKGTPPSMKFAEGRAGRDADVPEFKVAKPYDPFKVDIFQFGNMLRKEILQKYAGVEFLEPLVRDMTRTAAHERPNAKSLRVKFNTLRNRLTAQQIRAHLELKDTTDPLREHLASLGIASVLESESEDSPEHSSSEAPTTAHSSHSNESYWSARHLDSSVSSIEQPEQQGTLTKIVNKFRPSSPARTPSHGTAIPWKPSKPSKPRSPSPPPLRSAPQPIPDSYSASSSSTGSPKAEGRYFRTGKFPWSASSSPDSVGGQSPILAVVNHFLAPERFANNDEPFEHTYRPPVEERLGWSSTTAQASMAPLPIINRNRRNTVNTAPAPTAAPLPAVPSTRPVPPARARTGGWAPMETMFSDHAPEEAYSPFPDQQARQQMYSKPNKSTNTVSMLSPQTSQTTYSPWNAGAHSNGRANGASDMDPEGDLSWASEEALRSLNQSPLAQPAPSPVPVKLAEKKEPVVDKSAKPAKSPFSAFSKKSSPVNPIFTPASSSTTTLRAAVTSGKNAAASPVSENPKSTIGVEDGTPFNTPPKTVANLPTPVSTSPTTTKTKKAKGKKGSISEAPKEKPMVEEWQLPSINDPSNIKTRKRGGSGASTTSRPSSPLSIFGSRARSGSKTEHPPKPVAAKPAPPPKPSGFSWGLDSWGLDSWGLKSKASPPAEVEPENSAFSFAAPSFVSSMWNQGAEELPKEPPKKELPRKAAVPRTVTPPQPEPTPSDYEASASPVSTPPSKSGWKTKASCFSTDTQSVTASSPQEEEDLTNLLASMRMSVPRSAVNAEATPKAVSQYADGMDESPSFDFNFGSLNTKRGDDFWASAMDAFNVEPEEGTSPEPVEPAPVVPKAKAAKAKAEAAPLPTPAPEPVEAKTATIRGRKKLGALKAKATIDIESAAPTPANEAEDPWNLVTVADVAPTPKATLAPKQSRYADWLGIPDDMEGSEESQTPAFSPEPDSWFNVKPKAKMGMKASKASLDTAPAPAFSTAATKGPKGRKASRADETIKPVSAAAAAAVEPEPEPEEPKVEEANPMAPEDNFDAEWPMPIKAKGGKKKGAKEAEPVKVPATVTNKWASLGRNNENELAVQLVAELDEQKQATTDKLSEEANKEAEKEAATAVAAPPAVKSTAKPTPAKNAKGKKKGKR